MGAAILVAAIVLLVIYASAYDRRGRGRDCPCDHAGCEGRCRS